MSEDGPEWDVHATLEALRAVGVETMRQGIVRQERDRYAISTGVNWRFTTADARIKLKCVYPSH